MPKPLDLMEEITLARKLWRQQGGWRYCFRKSPYWTVAIPAEPFDIATFDPTKIPDLSMHEITFCLQVSHPSEPGWYRVVFVPEGKTDPYTLEEGSRHIA